jgi:protein SCO1/2
MAQVWTQADPNGLVGARTEAAGVRKFAAILGVQYRAMLNGDFSHSSIVTLVDRDGRIAARSDRIDKPDAELVAAAARVLHDMPAEH